MSAFLAVCGLFSLPPVMTWLDSPVDYSLPHVIANADVIGVVRLLDETTTRTEDRTVGSRQREFTAKWIEVWRRSPTVKQPDAGHEGRLILRSFRGETLAGGSFLVFVQDVGDGNYELIAGVQRANDLLEVYRDGRVQWPWSELDVVPTAQAKELIAKHAEDDRTQTFTTTPGNWGFGLDAKRPNAPWRRLTFPTMDAPSPDWPHNFDEPYTLVGRLKSEKLSDSAARRLDANIAYRISGAWSGGTFVIEQIVEVKSGETLLAGDADHDPAKTKQSPP